MSLLKLTGPAAPAIQALAAKRPLVARRLVSWTPSYAHALSIFLQAKRAVDAESAKQLFAANPRFEDASTLDLLRSAGFSHPDRLVVLLDRLTNRLALLHEYRRWEPLMLDKHVAGFITSMRTQLTPRKLDALIELEPDLRSARIMKQVRSKDDVMALDVIVAWVCRHCPAASPADVRQSLRSTKSDIDDWLEEWLMTAQLPPPPFPGTNLLVPLRTGADIKHAAQEFRNCLNSLLQDAVTGRIAFYVWQGKEPAVVSLKPLGRVGWMVDDIKGPKNARISTLTRRQISAEVSAWGCFPDDKMEDALRKWQAWSILL
jgi:hypothetical protein